MENIKELITIISAVLGLLATVTGFLIPLVKTVRAKNKLSAINKLTAQLQSFIMDAEQLVNYTGAEKKEYVLTKANRFAIDNDLPYNEQEISGKIEELITVSKNVNYNEKPAVEKPTAGSIRI